MTKMTIEPLHQEIMIEVLQVEKKLSICKALSDGGKVKKGDEILAKNYQITKTETAQGFIKKLKEVHVLGILN